MINNGFGGKDEILMQEHFEELVGGKRRAERMLHLWNISYKCDMRPQGKLHTKKDIFETKAIGENFTFEQIQCFYEL